MTLGEGKIKVGIPYKGTIVGFEIPEKVVILGMKLHTKYVMGAVSLLLGVGVLWFLWPYIGANWELKGKEETAHKTAAESESLQG